MYQTIILPLAKKDIKEAASWYNAKNEGLGKRYTEQVREKIKFVKKNPKACSIKYDTVRTIVLNSFPYMIHYTLDESKHLVIVIAILHTSRNPETWNI